MISRRLDLADALDRWTPRWHRLAEKLGWPQAWLHEFCTYLGQPRMFIEEFNIRYTWKRMDAETILKPVMTEEEARAFYQGHDYMLWRNIVHRKHSAWRRVLVTMRACESWRPEWYDVSWQVQTGLPKAPDRGRVMLEVGCAIAPVSAWCAERKPQWQYFLHDLFPSPHASYGLWRVRQRAPSGVMQWPTQANVITALDVFEHLSDPMKMARRCVETLAPGGYLHWNFVGNELRNDLDLATEEQHRETVEYLERELNLVWERHGYRVSRRRDERPTWRQRIRLNRHNRAHARAVVASRGM